MKVLGIIPARGGSKGIPRKNIADLGGKPLIAWTIAAARSAIGLDRVIVSTDDPEIAATARQQGAEVPFLRPPELAGDAAAALPVIRHALEWAQTEAALHYDAIAYLQPTSPFRTAADIDQAIEALTEADTVVSVVAVPHNMLPASLMEMDEDQHLHFTVPPEQRAFRRQDKASRLFARNGPAILAVRSEVIMAGNLYGTRIRSLVMPTKRSLDIDGPDDLEMARAMLQLKIV